jgi:hypothetical protein
VNVNSANEIVWSQKKQAARELRQKKKVSGGELLSEKAMCKNID